MFSKSNKRKHLHEQTTTINKKYKASLNNFYVTETNKNISIEHLIYLIEPYLKDLTNTYKDHSNNIKLVMNIFCINPNYDQIMCASNTEINSTLKNDTDVIVKNILNFFISSHVKKVSRNVKINFIDSIQYYIY